MIDLSALGIHLDKLDPKALLRDLGIPTTATKPASRQQAYFQNSQSTKREPRRRLYRRHPDHGERTALGIASAEVIHTMRGTTRQPRPTPTGETRRQAIEARRARADQYALALAETIVTIAAEPGSPSMREIARTLNAKNITTPAGGNKWTGVIVRRVLDRLDALDRQDTDHDTNNDALFAEMLGAAG